MTKNMQIGLGVTIKTEENSSLDLLLDDGMAFRIKEATVIKINENPQGKTPVQVILYHGKILAHLVASKLRRISSSGTYKLRIDTETAVCGIRGTIFSVGYYPALIATKVAVLEGIADVFKAQDFTETTAELGSGLHVPDGKKVEISKQIAALQDISSEERKELLEARELKIETSILERIHQAFDFISESLVGMHKIGVAKYGMGNLASAAILKAQFSGKLIDSLQDIELAKGTYHDPWGTDYLYVKINDRNAILISAGPDKIFHTPDDIYKYIQVSGLSP